MYLLYNKYKNAKTQVQSPHVVVVQMPCVSCGRFDRRLMDKIRTSLQGDRTVDLEVDSTKYHTSFHEKGDDGKPMKKNSNMGWHGDDKRKIVVGCV